MINNSFQKKIDYIKAQGFLRFYSHTNFSVNVFFKLIKDEKISQRFKKEEKTIKKETLRSFRKLEKLNKYLGLENVEKCLPVYYGDNFVWLGVNFFHILLKDNESNKKYLLDENGQTIEL